MCCFLQFSPFLIIIRVLHFETFQLFSIQIYKTYLLFLHFHLFLIKLFRLVFNCIYIINYLHQMKFTYRFSIYLLEIMELLRLVIFWQLIILRIPPIPIPSQRTTTVLSSNRITSVNNIMINQKAWL